MTSFVRCHMTRNPTLVPSRAQCYCVVPGKRSRYRRSGNRPKNHLYDYANLSGPSELLRISSRPVCEKRQSLSCRFQTTPRQKRHDTHTPSRHICLCSRCKPWPSHAQSSSHRHKPAKLQIVLCDLKSRISHFSRLELVRYEKCPPSCPLSAHRL